jgi:hypothetical protein
MEIWAEAEGTKQSKPIANAANPKTLSLDMFPPEGLRDGKSGWLRGKHSFQPLGIQPFRRSRPVQE